MCVLPLMVLVVAIAEKCAQLDGDEMRRSFEGLQGGSDCRGHCISIVFNSFLCSSLFSGQMQLCRSAESRIHFDPPQQLHARRLTMDRNW
jgi:hypothetical protein